MPDAARPEFATPTLFRISYGVTDAARAVGISRATMWKLIKEKRVATFKIGTRTLISLGALRALVRSFQQAA